MPSKQEYFRNRPRVYVGDGALSKSAIIGRKNESKFLKDTYMNNFVQNDSPVLSRESVNDDDIYIVKYQGKNGWGVVTNMGASSAAAVIAEHEGTNLRVGYAIVRGMALKGMTK